MRLPPPHSTPSRGGVRVAPTGRPRWRSIPGEIIPLRRAVGCHLRSRLKVRVLL
jgi:hypothetical protein